MARKIVILEDNAKCRQVMARCLDDRFYQFDRCFFDRAGRAVDFLAAHLPETILISLDHDLELLEATNGKPVDPGTGREVADFLARHEATCPVILHSTNTTAVAGMQAVLEDAGWKTARVIPCGDLEWIATDWFRTVRRAIVRGEAGAARVKDIR